MKTPEKIVFCTLSVVFLILFTNATRINSVAQQLDQAYFLETIDTTLESGRPTTMLQRSSLHLIKDLIVAPASKVCAYEFDNDGREYMNLYQRHSFPILYVLAALRVLFPTKIIYYMCALIAFPGLLFTLYFICRYLGLPVIIAIVLLLVVAFHPALSYSSFGQFYLDKLFPVLCVIYFFILNDWIRLNRRRPLAVLVIGILAASTSERSIIMLIAGTLAIYVMFGWRRRWVRLDMLPLMLVVVMAAYVYIYIHFVQHDPDYVFFLSGIMNFLSAIPKNGEALRAIYKFLFINVLLLVPFGIYAKRWTLIALGSMVPNLVGTIGGAEKLGWTTHYHSYYFPFLVVALIMGASSLFERGARGLISIAVTLSIGVALLYALIDPFPPPSLRFSLGQARQAGLVKTVEFATVSGPAQLVIERAKYLRNVAAFIPPGSEVSATEGYMPVLYEHGVKLIHSYPLGLGKSDYLVVPYTHKDSVERWEGFVSYLGPDVVEQVNSCLQNRITEKYTLLKEFPDSRLTGTAILQRN
jgi:hypothetical protein